MNDLISQLTALSGVGQDMLWQGLMVFMRVGAVMSLLPAFGGLNTHQRAIDMGCQFAGATVHQVTADLDHGPILAQAVVPVLPGDTANSLSARVLTQEHLLYPRAIEQGFSRAVWE